MASKSQEQQSPEQQSPEHQNLDAAKLRRAKERLTAIAKSTLKEIPEHVTKLQPSRHKNKIKYFGDV